MVILRFCDYFQRTRQVFLLVKLEGFKVHFYSIGAQLVNSYFDTTFVSLVAMNVE